MVARIIILAIDIRQYVSANCLIAFSASKFAVVGLCEALYRELQAMGFNGIHVTYVCPTFVNTGFVKNPRLTVGKVPEPEEVVEKLMEAVLLNRRSVAVPEDRRLSHFLR